MGHYHDIPASGAIFGCAIRMPFASFPLTHQKPMKIRVDAIRAQKRPANMGETEPSLCTQGESTGLEDGLAGMTRGIQDREPGLLIVCCSGRARSQLSGWKHKDHSLKMRVKSDTRGKNCDYQKKPKTPKSLLLETCQVQMTKSALIKKTHLATQM